MLTLREARLTLRTINLLAYLVVLPYHCKVANGKFIRLPSYRLVFWYFGFFISILHTLNAVSQAVHLYWLSDHIDLPLHIVLIHIGYIFAAVVFICLLCVVIKVHSMILVLFNQLFQGER